VGEFLPRHRKLEKIVMLLSAFANSLSPTSLRLHLIDHVGRWLASLARGQHVPKRAVKCLARLVTPQFARSLNEALPLILVRGAMSHVYSS
jgi:hypothetical protein